MSFITQNPTGFTNLDTLLVQAKPQSISILPGESVTIILSGIDLKNNFPLQYFIKSNQTISNAKIFTSQGLEINPLQSTNFLLPDNKIIFTSTGNADFVQNIKFFVRTIPNNGSSEQAINSQPANIKIDINSSISSTSNDINLKKLIEYFNSVKKPQITLVTEFKSLFDTNGRLTEIGKSFFEKFSSISNINNILNASLLGSNFINENQKNNKIEMYDLLPQLTKEVQYLKDLNKAVFDATHSVNFLDEGLNRNGIVFKGARNNSIANLFFLASSGTPPEIINKLNFLKSSIVDFTAKDFLNELGYDQNFIDSEIKNRFVNSPTKTFLFILENIKNLHLYHAKIGKKSNKLTSSRNDFLILDNLLSQMPSVFNPVNFSSVSKFDDLVKQKLDSLSFDRKEKNIAKLQTAFNNICYQASGKDPESKELLTSYSDVETSNDVKTYIENHIFGRYSEEIKLINNSSSKNSIQHIALTKDQVSGQNNVNLEAFDELLENINNNKYTLTAKSVFVKSALKITKDQANYIFSTEKLKNRIDELNSIITSYRNTSLLSDVLSNSRVNYYFDINNFSKNELNYLSFLFNFSDFFKVYKVQNPNLPLVDYNFNDRSLFLFKLAKNNKKIKMYFFIYCSFYLSGINELNKVFLREVAIKIEDEFKSLFPFNNNSGNFSQQDIIEINFIDFFEKLKNLTGLADPSIDFINKIFHRIYSLSSENQNTTILDSKTLSNLYLIFDSCVDLLDLIFNVTIVSSSNFSNGKISVIQNKKEKTKERFEDFMLTAIKPMKLKFMSFSFINKIVEDVRSSYSNLLTLLSNNSTGKFNNDLKPALDYIFSSLGISELGENFLSMIIDDNNVDKSVRNFEYVKTQLLKEPDRKTRFFDSMYEFTTSHSQQVSMNMLETFFKKHNFVQNIDEFFNKKIISIGLPTGFIKNIKIQNSENKTSVDSTLIKINLYKTDLRFPEIILKPKSFLFECSRYINETFGYNTSVGSIKPHMINFVKGSNILLTTFLNPLQPGNDQYKKTFSDDIHGFLTESQKQEIVNNHIIDHFLKIYLRIFNNGSRHFLDDNLSALNISNSFFNKDIENYTREILKPLNLLNISGNDLEKLKLNIFNMFSNVSNKLYLRDYIYLPKRFDRIFNIIVNPDDFVIDFETSKQLNFQNDEQKLYRYLDKVENLRRDSRIDTSDILKLPFVSADDGEVVFDQYIFDIELL